MKRFATATVMALLSTACAARAAASTIMLNETFTISGFSSGALLSTLTGSFSLSFDNSADALDTRGRY